MLDFIMASPPCKDGESPWYASRSGAACFGQHVHEKAARKEDHLICKMIAQLAGMFAMIHRV
jgi:hypothetical protein